MRHHLSQYLLPLLLLGLGGLACGGDDSTLINHPPTLIGPNAQTTQVSAGSPVELGVEATDSDGDALTYAWAQSPASPAGAFNDASARNPTWTAPQVESAQRFTLTVTVSDGRDGITQGTVAVDVSRALVVNKPPTVSTPTATPATPIDEQQSVALAVNATDLDGDTLTYAWEQVTPGTPRGTFSAPASAQTSWKAPDVLSSGTYTLRVTVTDGKGGSTQATVDVAVQKVNQPPTVNATLSGPATLLAGATGTFTVTASDPDGDPLTFAWSQTAPASKGTWVGGATGASAQWFSPEVATGTSFTLSVSVTDGASTPVVRSLTVFVSVPRYSTDVQGVWSSGSCTGCHGTSGGLNLASGSSYSHLVNVNATVASCSTLKRVQPGDPDNSALIRKMEGTTCGSRMPQKNTAYFDQNPGLVVRVRSWILAGAAND
ncbi:Ig-like domain-containing protein [Corallococcus sp. BB11-1]|uniref:Ig-like domain-containing protein n=1 Tax=Corallococcus sp. BB11-1 TaxID=2996783 RepID=UPI002270CAEF|nr:Ig-like domain-containing protein [Corallococcus sp. BB11-1]MCY1035076.1 Ig-like domain-containing protein [Corallococcus sp. BB11-1]